MKKEKISPALSERLQGAGGDDVFEVVIELRPLQSSSGVRGGGIRAAGSSRPSMQAAKASFTREISPIVRRVQRAGGEVIGAAWLNRTLKARVPARGVEPLTDLAGVVAVDAPRVLQAE